ncbi:hypothetical protein BDV95DRAFT_638924 [Massariosphaeria phaeospora]|uniref:RING-type domain-containing protein n=1 Tax=Massariosphaeria phaeospora TaxID=100035 RepID=A0A7C8M793_9PLEO|nr:hypothetical protein BDV95DRAFT_638924 [Massariosphaeria phaeospora]
MSCSAIKPFINPDVASATCSICLDPYDATEHRAVRVAGTHGCTHIFGAQCLMDWFQSGATNRHSCPCCRRAFPGLVLQRVLASEPEEDTCTADRAAPSALDALLQPGRFHVFCFDFFFEISKLDDVRRSAGRSIVSAEEVVGVIEDLVPEEVLEGRGIPEVRVMALERVARGILDMQAKRARGESSMKDGARWNPQLMSALRYGI